MAAADKNGDGFIEYDQDEFKELLRYRILRVGVL